MQWSRRLLLCSLLACSFGAPAAQAASGPWQQDKVVEARLVSAVEGTGTLTAVPLGLELKLKEGWKTYWRSPGDAGLPPALDWTGSQNFGTAALAYPFPHRFTLLKNQTFGYADHVVYPLALQPVTPGAPLDLKAKLDVLVCAQVCVPQTLNLTLLLPAGEAAPGPEAQLINRFQSLVPATGASSGLTISEVRAISIDGQPGLEVEASASASFTAPDVFVEAEPEASFSAPQVTLLADGRTALLRLALTSSLPVGTSLAGRAATLTLVDGERAVERKTLIVAGTTAASSTGWLASLAMFGFALLGGLVLNLMPCVLPVLSLKLMALVRHGDAPPATVRANFLATAAGIVASLLALAGVLIALKSAGLAVGWGIQFQQPVFIAAVAVIVALFACNLWGFFEINLPSRLTNIAGTAGGSGEGLASNFAIGAFATLLATPCSAPFVGTAVGFALAGGPAQILLIFLALGLGLASPYLLIAGLPRLAQFIPRPGMWMVRLRQVLGFALAGTAVWLLTILPAQVGLTVTLVIAGLVLAMVLALCSLHLRPIAAAGTLRIATGALALAAISLPLLFGARAGHGAADTGAADSIGWTPFDRAQVRSLVSQGKTVFVDVTADWCVVCKSNKALVLNTSIVSQRISAATIAMRADWTSPDAKISAFLASFGRYGIPLNVVYGPGAPAGILLPELLTQEAVLGAIEAAGKVGG